MNPSLDDPSSALLLATFAELPTTFFLLNGLGIIVLLLLSGLVSGSEVAFFSLSHEQMQQVRTSDQKKDKYISFLVSDPRRLLASILILNNLINIFIITISTYVTWQIVGDKNTGGVVIVILTAIITVLIIFFGEILPKVYANHNNLSFARFTSSLLYYSSKILRPIAWLLMSISDIIESRIERKGYNLSVDQINHALEITSEQEEVTAEEKDMLKGIVNFSTLSVKQVMKSRMDITAVDKSADFHELMDQINKTGFSRIPIYEETIDKIEGILYIKDLLPHLNKEDDFQWQTLLRPGFFIPESKKIDALLKDFQEKQVHMAIVIDEYGGTSGLITFEDVIEEIVGEINDEFDDDRDVAYSKIDTNTYVFEGKTSLNDFCKITNLDSSRFEEVKGDSESLGGLLLEMHTKLPHAGEKIEYEAFTFTVVAVDQKRIKRIRVYINPEKEESSKEFED